MNVTLWVGVMSLRRWWAFTKRRWMLWVLACPFIAVFWVRCTRSLQLLLFFVLFPSFAFFILIFLFWLQESHFRPPTHRNRLWLGHHVFRKRTPHPPILGSCAWRVDWEIGSGMGYVYWSGMAIIGDDHYQSTYCMLQTLKILTRSGYMYMALHDHYVAMVWCFGFYDIVSYSSFINIIFNFVCMALCAYNYYHEYCIYSHRTCGYY